MFFTQNLLKFADFQENGPTLVSMMVEMTKISMKVPNTIYFDEPKEPRQRRGSSVYTLSLYLTRESKSENFAKILKSAFSIRC